MQQPSYCGRFAPSPTGSLHFGSLIAALGSALSARWQQGRWLVRIEDLDPPREEPGAATAILHTLESYGFEWDGEVLYQSHRATFYDAALTKLHQRGALYACDCSRKQLQLSATLGSMGPIYPGICRDRQLPLAGHALRVKTADQTIRFHDRRCGPQQQNLTRELGLGDFVVKRRDGLFAYQLAVVIDDAEQGITEVVRGEDLLDNSARQIHLQQLLGLPTPDYCHLPLACGSNGEKLSKQNHAAPLRTDNAVEVLKQAWKFLYQSPIEPKLGTVAEFWQWALAKGTADLR